MAMWAEAATEVGAMETEANIHLLALEELEEVERMGEVLRAMEEDF